MIIAKAFSEGLRWEAKMQCGTKTILCRIWVRRGFNDKGILRVLEEKFWHSKRINLYSGPEEEVEKKMAATVFQNVVTYKAVKHYWSELVLPLRIIVQSKPA